MKICNTYPQSSPPYIACPHSEKTFLSLLLYFVNILGHPLQLVTHSLLVSSPSAHTEPMVPNDPRHNPQDSLSHYKAAPA